MRFDQRTFVLCTASLMLAALIPVSAAVSAPEAPPTPNAVQLFREAQGCTPADPTGSVLVIAPPAGFVLSWMSPCVIIPNGGTVNFRQADAIPHGAVSLQPCFDLGRMSAVGGTPAAADPATTSVKIDFLAEEGIAYTTLNGAGFGSCESLQATETSVTIEYECIIHGALMPGKIIVEL